MADPEIELAGLWHLPGAPPTAKVPGTLTWRPPGRPRLEIVEPTPGTFAPGRSDPWTHDVIYGDVGRFGYVTGFFARTVNIEIIAPVQHRFSLRFCITRMHMDSLDEPLFRRVEAQIPALAVLLGPDSIAFDWRKRERQRIILTKDRRHMRSSVDGCNVEIEYNWRARHEFKRFELDMKPTFTVSARRRLPLKTLLDEWFAPFNQLLEILTGRPSDPETIAVWSEQRPDKTQRLTNRFEIFGAGIQPGQVDYNYRIEPITRAGAFRRHPEGLAGVIRDSRKLADEQGVFLDLLSGVIQSSERPLRNRYLDIVTALEAYHSRRFGIAKMTTDAYKTTTQNILTDAKKRGMSATSVKFLRRWLSPSPSRRLHERLTEIADLLGRRSSLSATPERLAQLRNDVAHGNDGLDAGELRSAFDDALDMARRLVLSELHIG